MLTIHSNFGSLSPTPLFFLFSSKLHYLSIFNHSLTLIEKTKNDINLISLLNSPCFIGELEFIGVSDSPYNVKALNECICISIPIECKKHLLESVKFLKFMYEYLARKILTETFQQSKKIKETPKTLLANNILENSKPIIVNEKAFEIYNEKRKDVAELLGFKERTLYNILNDFKNNGILEKNEYGYIIKNKRMLEIIANKYD